MRMIFFTCNVNWIQVPACSPWPEAFERVELVSAGPHGRPGVFACKICPCSGIAEQVIHCPGLVLLLMAPSAYNQAGHRDNKQALAPYDTHSMHDWKQSSQSFSNSLSFLNKLRSNKLYKEQKWIDLMQITAFCCTEEGSSLNALNKWVRSKQFSAWAL